MSTGIGPVGNGEVLMDDTRSRRWGTAVATLAVVLAVASCGGDDDDDQVAVTAVDYAFQGLPATVDPGTKLTLTNASSAEFHEMVVFRLPDGEARSAEELVALPEEQLDALFIGPPTLVLLAPPDGAPQIEAVGDGTLTEPGRYVMFCAIPTGADPDAFLAALETATDGPPDVAGGPPHFVNGMFAEITVR